MARIRSIKPEFWSDRKLARLASRDARTLYIALWNLSDEHSRVNGDPQWLKGQVFPYDDDIDAPYITRLLVELSNPALGAVVGYEADDDPYLHLPKLAKHQRLEPDKVASRLPAPPDPGPPGPPPGNLAPEPGPSAPEPGNPEPVTDPSESRAGKSAPRTDRSGQDEDEPALLYVAGSREQGAGSRAAAAGVRARARAHEPAPPPHAPPEIAELRERLEAARLVVRWDKLTADQVNEIGALVTTHGAVRLVQAASREYQPNSPPAYAQAWLPGWRALPPPGRNLHAVARTCAVHLLEEPCRGCAGDRKAGEAAVS